MRKDITPAKITKYEVKRNREISKKSDIRFQPVGLPGRRVEQYFGLSHLHDSLRLGERYASERGYVARFRTIVKNTLDCMFRQIAFNLSRVVRVLGVT